MIFIHTRIGECTRTIDILSVQVPDVKICSAKGTLALMYSCSRTGHSGTSGLVIMAGAAVSRRLQTGGWLGCALLGGWRGRSDPSAPGVGGERGQLS